MVNCFTVERWLKKAEHHGLEVQLGAKGRIRING